MTSHVSACLSLIDYIIIRPFDWAGRWGITYHMSDSACLRLMDFIMMQPTGLLFRFPAMDCSHLTGA
jgi:hypothetical protein